jgi:DNA-binding transcriptional ArsR family regulator
LSAEDRAAGYWWELSMRQVEISRTLVLDDPRRARSFFEALVQDNIGIGRPEEVSMLFVRGRGRPTQHPHGTRIFSAGSDVRIDFRYKHSRVKQYLKGGRALRIETVINNPSDVGVARRLQHLPQLIDKARQINQRLLTIEQAGQSCAIGSALFERIHLPYNREGQRTGALRFGDSRAMALAGALCHVLEGLTGFTNKTLRGLVAAHLGRDYSQSQMSYDLRRLRLHGLIHRLPRRNTYQLTSEGIRVTVFYTKLQNRLLRPLLDANKPPAPIEIRRALTTLEHAVAEYIQNARLAPAP